MLCVRRGLSVVGFVSALALPLAGCQKKAPSSEAPPPPPSGLPPLTGGAAPTTGARPEHAPSLGGGELPQGHPTLPPGHAGGMGMGGPGASPGPGMGGGAMGGMDPNATPGNIPFDPKSVIAGELRLGDKVKDKVASGDTIYLVVRSADRPGPPLAVKRLAASSWPLKFSIDGRDAMMAGTQMGGKVTLSARVDKDGDAMTKNPGDVTGQTTLEPPSSKVVVTLDNVL